MARPKVKTPAIKSHISGQAVCRINGIDFYLGPDGSPESLARYAVLVREYQSNGLSLPEGFNSDSLKSLTVGFAIPTSKIQLANEPITVKQVSEAYRLHSERKHKLKDHRTYDAFDKLCDELSALPPTEAEQFGPRALGAMRSRWEQSGKLSRPYVNRKTNWIIRIFKWAVSQELVSESAYRRLRTIEPLRRGDSVAIDHPERQAVPLEDVQKTIPHLSPIVRDMVSIQVATGMRPSELCDMRPMDIDRAGKVWFYAPAKHKNMNKGKSRTIALDADCQEVLANYLNRADDSYLFSPSEAMALLRAKQRSERKGYGSHKKPVANPAKRPGNRYSDGAYRRAITRGCKLAKVDPWTPYQIRHLTAVVVRDALGLESSQAILGHSDIKTTQRYAKQTIGKLVEASRHAPKILRGDVDKG